MGGAAVFAGCVVYSDYQNGNVSDFGTYLAAAIAGAIVGAISYMFIAQAALAIKTIAGGAQFIGLLGAQLGIPFLMTNATLLATIAGYGLAGFFGIQGANFFLSSVSGSENALLSIFFEEGSPEFYQALAVYNDVALLGNILGGGYLQEAARHMPPIAVPASTGAEKPTPAEEASIKETVINKGQSLKDEGLTKRELGPAVAGAYDKTTGETYTAINNPKGNLPTEMHPIIKDRIENMPPDVTNVYVNTHGPGSHAEVYAANEALLTNPNARPEDITIYRNGNIKRISTMVNGKMHGNTTEWYENGNLKSEASSKYSFDLNYKKWDEAGTLVKEVTEPTDFEKRMIEKYDKVWDINE